jgi:hypothetical protein
MDSITDSNGSTTDIDNDKYAKPRYFTYDNHTIYYYDSNGNLHSFTNSKRKKHAASAGDRDAAVTKFRLIGGTNSGNDCDPDCNGDA